MDYISVTDISKIQLHIYVLGYYPIGESILIIIWDDKDLIVRKSLLMDCFEQNSTNQMIPILDKYNLQHRKLDFIIWSHPDYDHSIGFSGIMNKYCSKNTTCLMPDGCSKSILSFFRGGIFKSWISFTIRQLKGTDVERVNSSNKRKYPTIYGGTKYSDGVNDDIEFNFEILTPFANQVFRKFEINKNHKRNDISISLMIRFGNQNFYFGGDSENAAIDMIEQQKLHNIIFIKIPHHASTTSTHLPLKLYDIKNGGMMGDAISISTSFKRGRSNLPDNSVLDMYKPFSSKILLTEKLPHKDNYGIWKFVYNIKPLQIINPEPYGDASSYF